LLRAAAAAAATALAAVLVEGEVREVIELTLVMTFLLVPQLL
jgi:hypothetical protein